MVSAIDVAKRALVSLLKTLCGVYGIALGVSRNSPDKDVCHAPGAKNAASLFQKIVGFRK